jgi:hypothetical protein
VEGAAEPLGTSEASSFRVFANNFSAENLTFQNTAPHTAGQGPAMWVYGDQAQFRNCRFLGDRDTLYVYGYGSRQYYKNCYIEGTTDFILSNTFSQIERGMRELGDHGTRFEFECYDVGHLYNLAHFVGRGLVKPPFFVQCIFGILGGIGPDPENLMHMKTTADRLFGNDYYLSVLGAGRHQFPLVTMSAILGGNVRVGLEDNLYLGRGELATSNGAQVAKIRGILEGLSLEIATPDEARQMLQTKGKRNVGF